MMAQYLIEVGYTAASWSSQIDSQANVVERITPAVKAVKGKIECAYYAFGDADLIAIIDFPTAEAAAAFALTVTGSGALRSYKTTPLLTVDQGMASMKRAAEIRGTYTPPMTVDLTEKKTAKAR
jgi:uncharacterized protein with GYD domain